VYYSAIPVFLFFTVTPPSAIYTLSLHDALPIWVRLVGPPHPGLRRDLHAGLNPGAAGLPLTWTVSCRRQPLDRRSSPWPHWPWRSEEHTSELQSRFDLVCRLLLEKKKQNAGPPA